MQVKVTRLLRSKNNTNNNLRTNGYPIVQNNQKNQRTTAILNIVDTVWQITNITSTSLILNTEPDIGSKKLVSNTLARFPSSKG